MGRPETSGEGGERARGEEGVSIDKREVEKGVRRRSGGLETSGEGTARTRNKGSKGTGRARDNVGEGS